MTPGLRVKPVAAWITETEAAHLVLTFVLPEVINRRSSVDDLNATVSASVFVTFI